MKTHGGPKLHDVAFIEVLRETPLAYLLVFAPLKTEWLPKSQVELHLEDLIITVPYWLVRDKGLDNYVVD